MGRKHIKKSDAIRVNAYLHLTNSLITIREGYWEVQNTDDTWYCETTEELMEEINYDLEEMKEFIDPETYEDAFDNDGRLAIR